MATPSRETVILKTDALGAFGGWLVAEPLAGRGFRVIAEVPIEGAV